MTSMSRPRYHWVPNLDIIDDIYSVFNYMISYVSAYDIIVLYHSFKAMIS